MSILKTKGLVDRLHCAQKKARDCVVPERALEILNEAIDKEVAMVRAIESMAGFRSWLEGERFDLSKIRGRK